MIQLFKNFIKEEKLFQPGDQILLAVSGGIDSVVMTELFEKIGFKYAIAHCNFHLRGNESDDDAVFVENLSKKNKVKFHIAHFDTKKFAEQNKISIQMAARQLRINWFESLLNENGYQYYATAHHQDDQIETFLINLIRGTGISGLHGILPKHGRLIHPMLFSERTEIERFAKRHKIFFREDSSNLRSDYTRNKIRHHLIPVIRELNPEYLKVFTENIERLGQAEMIYLQQINSIADTLISKEENQIKISIPLLLELEPAATYLYEIISPYGFNFSEVTSILTSLTKQSGKMFLSNSHRLYKDRDYLIIEQNNNSEIKKTDYQIDIGTREIWNPVRLEFHIYERTPDFKFSDNNNQAFLDAGKISYPLQLRKWNKGDCFYPLGMKHKKLISDFFIDKKLSIPEKKKVWLLTSGDQVAWIIGHRIDNRFKITNETKEVLRIQYSD